MCQLEESSSRWTGCRGDSESDAGLQVLQGIGAYYPILIMAYSLAQHLPKLEQPSMIAFLVQFIPSWRLTTIKPPQHLAWGNQATAAPSTGQRSHLSTKGNTATAAPSLMQQLQHQAPGNEPQQRRAQDIEGSFEATAMQTRRRALGIKATAALTLLSSAAPTRGQRSHRRAEH